MKIGKIALCLVLTSLMLSSCKKDEDLAPIQVEIRDRNEQQVIDNDSILWYLNNHYYNSGIFVGNPNPSLDQIVITQLPDDGILPDPGNNTLLINAVETKNTTLIDGEDEFQYQYYVLKINQGGGSTSPNVFDSVQVNYFGNLLDETHFDSTANPTIFDMLTLIPGWNRVIPDFNTAESFEFPGDGTIAYNNYGLGVMFLPSGLAFWATVSNNVPVYSPVIFKFELMQMEVNDHDFDGVPTHLEDLEDDFLLSNNDTDNDGFSNYLDPDDDGDGTLTSDELETNQYIVDTNMGEQEPILGLNEYETARSVENGVITIDTVVLTDSNNDGTPDYLDDTISGD